MSLTVQTTTTNMAGPQPPVIEGFVPSSYMEKEQFSNKFMRKVRENPFVPIGCLATAGVLTYGLITFKQGKTRQSQMLMRARVLSQGFTVAAILVGGVMASMKSRPQ